MTKFVLTLLLNIIFYVLVVLAIVELSSIAYDFTYRIYGNVSVETAPGTEVEFQIQPGESTQEIATKLARNRIVNDKFSFFIRAKLSINKERPILPGTYLLSTAMNYSEIIETITDPSKMISEEEE